MCDYCGEEYAQKRIANPNMWEEEVSFWDVCITCEKIINEQMKLSFATILQSRKNNVAKEFSNKIIKETTENINKLAYESGKEVLSATIDFGSQEGENKK